MQRQRFPVGGARASHGDRRQYAGQVAAFVALTVLLGVALVLALPVG